MTHWMRNCIIRQVLIYVDSIINEFFRESSLYEPPSDFQNRNWHLRQLPRWLRSHLVAVGVFESRVTQ
jgi:hypothetical protein